MVSLIIRFIEVMKLKAFEGKIQLSLLPFSYLFLVVSLWSNLMLRHYNLCFQTKLLCENVTCENLIEIDHQNKFREWLTLV